MDNPVVSTKEEKKSLLQKMQELPKEKKGKLVRTVVIVASFFCVIVWGAAFPAATHMDEANGTTKKGFGIGETLRSGVGIFTANVMNSASSTSDETSTSTSSLEQQATGTESVSKDASGTVPQAQEDNEQNKESN